MADDKQGPGYTFPEDAPVEEVKDTNTENKGGDPGADKGGEAPAAEKDDLTPEKVFGENTYKSWDEVKAIHEKWTGTAKELEELRTAKTTLEEQLAGATNPFANDDLAKLNEFVKRHKTSDFTMYSRITNALADAADPIEVIVTEKIFRNPERYKGKEDMLRKQIREQFNYDPADTDADRKQMALFNLEESADQAKAKLSEAVKDLQPKPNEIPEKRAADKAAIAGAWKEGLGKLEFKNIPIPIEKEGKPQPGFVDFALTDEMKTELFTEMTEYAAGKGLQLTKETMQEAYSAKLGNFVLKNLPKIALVIAQKARTLEGEEYDKLIHNPSGLNKNQERKEEAQAGMAHLFD